MRLENGSLLEYGWTFTGIATFLILLWAVFFFVGRLQLALAEDVDTDTKLLALIKVIFNLGGLSIQVGFVLAGMIAIDQPPISRATPITPAGLVVALSILWAEVALAGLALMDVLLIRWAKARIKVDIEQIYKEEEKRKALWTEEERQERLSEASK